MTTRTMTTTTLVALTILLVGCSSGEQPKDYNSSSASKTTTPSARPSADSPSSGTSGESATASASTQSLSAGPTSSSTTSAPLADDTPHVESFTLNDRVSFTSENGTTGTITFNQAAPTDVAQGLEWAGKPVGVWAVVHVDNRNGAEPITFSDVAPLLLDSEGTRYPMECASDVASNLYGDAESGDPHEDDYYDIYDRYSKAQDQVVAGEVRDIHVYSPVALPEKIARGTVSIDADPDPLMIQK